MTLAALRREIKAILCGAAHDYAHDPAWETDEILRLVTNATRRELPIGDREIEEEAVQKALLAANRRAAGEPLGYVLGTSPFFGRDFAVGDGVLIPRADSEVLIEEALARIAPEQNGTLLDLCCGSGCLGLTVLAERENLTGAAVDLSPDAIRYTTQNSRLVGVDARLTVHTLDVLHDPIPAEPTGAGYDLILCNPPYITGAEMKALDSQVQKEPSLALYGGEDGLDFYRILTARLFPLLSPDGTVIYEIGARQAEAVCTVARSAGFSTRVRRDWAGRDRALILQKTTVTE